MFRRSLFWGLTLMLVAVLVWLIINGRKAETRLAAAPAEVIQTARLSATRVIAPNDLEPAETNVARQAAAGQVGPITIRNRGNVAYHGTMLRLQCLDAGGKIVDARSRLVPETIAPGQSVTIDPWTLADVPRSVVRYRIVVAYSDLGPAPGLDDGATRGKRG